MWVWAGQEAAGLQAQKQLSGGPLVNGVPLQRAPLFQVAGDLVRRLHLEAHVDKPVATYSGGTTHREPGMGLSWAWCLYLSSRQWRGWC